MRLAILALSLALAAPARGQDPLSDDPAPETVAASADAAPPSPTAAGTEDARGFPPPRWGLALGAGFPEGVAVSAVYRPVSQIRLWAGPAWSVVAFGLQAGVTVVPWHLGVSPLLSFEGGRYFAADAGFLARGSSGIPDEIEPLLEDVSYGYAAAHVGLEIGARDAFAISLRAGLAYVSIDATGRATVNDSGGSGTTATFVDPKVRGTLPSVKLGVQLWF